MARDVDELRETIAQLTGRVGTLLHFIRQNGLEPPLQFSDEEIAKLHDDGWSFTKIGKKFGISANTANKKERRYRIKNCQHKYSEWGKCMGCGSRRPRQ